MASVSSCRDADDPRSEEPGKDIKVKLRIAPLYEYERSAESVEIIKSLRIILTDKDGKLKANRYVSLTDEYATFLELPQTLEFETTTGLNHVYVIANEESVENYSIEGEANTDNQKSLSERLNSFFEGNSSVGDFLNSIYFEPDYSKPIPQSSYYELNVKETTNVTEPINEFKVYLVNVATKFELNFYNYRNEPVTFKSISIDKIADQNYLMARIDQEDLFKTVEEDDSQPKEYWWVDWLKAVADDTNDHPNLDNTDDSNDLINDKWGWLKGYHLPNAAKHDNAYILAPDDDSWTVEKSTPQTGKAPEPGKLEGKGPFYFPESKYIPEGEKSQVYLMNFTILTTNGTETEEKIFQSELGYVTTLFRNTFITVNIELYSGQILIYVEIGKWKENDPVYGIIEKE